MFNVVYRTTHKCIQNTCIRLYIRAIDESASSIHVQERPLFTVFCEEGELEFKFMPLFFLW